MKITSQEHEFLAFYLKSCQLRNWLVVKPCISLPELYGSLSRRAEHEDQASPAKKVRRHGDENDFKVRPRPQGLFRVQNGGETRAGIYQIT